MARKTKWSSKRFAPLVFDLDGRSSNRTRWIGDNGVVFRAAGSGLWRCLPCCLTLASVSTRPTRGGPFREISIYQRHDSARLGGRDSLSSLVMTNMMTRRTHAETARKRQKSATRSTYVTKKALSMGLSLVP